MARTIYVALPAYNEAGNIEKVLKALEAHASRQAIAIHAIVVDDGSRDSTPDIIRRYSGSLPVSLVEHQKNQGLAAAIRSGLIRALELAGTDDIVVTMDADDTHTPAAIDRMIEGIDGGMDVLIASRYMNGSVIMGVPPFRRFLSLCASWIFRILLPIPGVKDFTCGYRAYRASALRAAFARYEKEFIDQEGFQCMVDILLKMRRMSLLFAEVPFILRYDQKSGKSKMKVLRTIRKTLVLLAKRRLGR